MSALLLAVSMGAITWGAFGHLGVAIFVAAISGIVEVIAVEQQRQMNDLIEVSRKIARSLAREKLESARLARGGLAGLRGMAPDALDGIRSEDYVDEVRDGKR